MIRGENALTKLFEIGICQRGAELRLTEQDGLHRGATVDRDVGQHAQLFERRHRQVLHLVHHQQAAPPGGTLIARHALEATQQRRLVGAAIVGHAEIGHREAQQVVAGDPRGDDARHHVAVPVELRPELLDQRGLAGADLAGDDDEAFLLRQTIDQVRDRAAVAARAEEEPAVGRELKGNAG